MCHVKQTFVELYTHDVRIIIRSVLSGNLLRHVKERNRSIRLRSINSLYFNYSLSFDYLLFTILLILTILFGIRPEVKSAACREAARFRSVVWLLKAAGL